MAAEIPEAKFSEPSNLEDAKHIPRPYKLRNYYTPNEVKKHCMADDCWVSFFGHVYDLTLLIQTNFSKLCEPLIKAAGTDITHWFDRDTRDPLTFIDPETNLLTVYCPYGRFLHVPPLEPDSEWNGQIDLPWWRDESLCIGKLSAKTRKL